MGLASWIPFRNAFWKAQHGKAIKVAGEGHDLVAQVEWADGNVTFMGADYLDDGDIRLANGLPCTIVGRGGEPVQIAGCQMIRVHAEHGCPVDPRIAIIAGKESDGDFIRVDENGNIVDGRKQAELEQAEQPSVRDRIQAAAQRTAGDEDGGVLAGARSKASDAVARATGDDNTTEDGDLRTDGGLPQRTAPAPETDEDAVLSHGYETQSVYDHQFEFNEDSAGYVYSLRDAVEYVPNSITPMALKRAEERGKDAASDVSPIKLIAIGAVGVLGILLFLAIVGVAIWKILGLGGGSSNSQNVGAVLAFAVTTRRVDTQLVFEAASRRVQGVVDCG